MFSDAEYKMCRRIHHSTIYKFRNKNHNVFDKIFKIKKFRDFSFSNLPYFVCVFSAAKKKTFPANFPSTTSLLQV